MTYNVFSGTLNLTQSMHCSIPSPKWCIDFHSCGTVEFLYRFIRICDLKVYVKGHSNGLNDLRNSLLDVLKDKL